MKSIYHLEEFEYKGIKFSCDVVKDFDIEYVDEDSVVLLSCDVKVVMILEVCDFFHGSSFEQAAIAQAKKECEELNEERKCYYDI